VSSSKVLLQINGDNANIMENKSNGNDIELRSLRDNDSRAPLVATISPASPVVVVAVTAPPPSLTVNESRRKKEDNMAVIFMGFILVFLVCHLPRLPFQPLPKISPYIFNCTIVFFMFITIKLGTTNF
jgi:hypothetical protein